jgi:hypothetical protein
LESEQKIFIKLPSHSWHGYETESLWSEIDGNFNRIINIPFYAKGISYGDIVTVRNEKDLKVIENVVKKSGHSTYRIFSLTSEGDKLDFYWKLLEELGCSYEQATTNLFAVDVPPQTDINKVYEILQLGEKYNIWEFEEGNCVHVTKVSTI